MTPKRGTLLRPLAHTWVRGPAARDRDQIVIDGRRATVYQPLTLERNPGIALARVRTPDDAVTFATEFGLLTEPSRWLDFEPIPATLSQSWVDFERVATEARRNLNVILDVRAAGRDNRAALARLRKDFGLDPDSDQRIVTRAGTIIRKARDVIPADEFPQDDRGILIRASAWAASGLSQNLVHTHAYVFEPAQLFPSATQTPGQIRIGWIGRTLLDYCHIGLAQALATEPIALCQECHRPYVVEDKRQRFCETTCANRARFRKFKARNVTTPNAHRRRSSRKPTKR